MIALMLAVAISGAWSRPAFDNAVVYATLRNGSARPVALVGASASVAQSVELHRSMPMHGRAMSGAGMPAMEMAPVTKIRIPPHGSVALRPGGFHVMLLGLRRPLHAGDHFDAVFRFDDGERRRVRVAVENRAF